MELRGCAVHHVDAEPTLRQRAVKVSKVRFPLEKLILVKSIGARGGMSCRFSCAQEPFILARVVTPSDTRGGSRQKAAVDSPALAWNIIACISRSAPVFRRSDDDALFSRRACQSDQQTTKSVCLRLLP